MKVYDIVLEKKVDPAGGIASKVIYPDGRIEVLLDMGNNKTEVLTFKNQKELTKELTKTKAIIKDKLDNFKFAKKLGSYGLWGTATAISVADGIYKIVDEYKEYGVVTPQRITQEVVGVIPPLVASIVVTGFKTGKILPWVKHAMDARKAAQLATAALGAAGVATGGTTWIGAAISGATWLALEIAIYFAVEYLAEYFMEEYILDDPLEPEVRANLTHDIAVAIGLSIAGDPAKEDKPISNMTPDDIKKLGADKIDTKKYDAIANKPEYAPAMQDYQSRRDTSNGRVPRKSVTDSITYESEDTSTPSPKGFLQHLQKRGYKDKTVKKVAKLIKKNL